MLEFNITVNEQNFNQLQSKELRSNLKKMLDAMSGVSKNQWKYAIALHNIVSNEQFKPDFKTMSDFSQAIGLDKSTVSRYVSAVKVLVNDVTPLTGLTNDTIPYSKCARLAGVKDVKDFLKSMNIDLLTISMRELEKAIKEYKESQNAPKNVVQENDSETQAVETEKQEELPTFTGRYDDTSIWFSIGNTKYIIPVDELKHYKVK